MVSLCGILICHLALMAAGLAAEGRTEEGERGGGEEERVDRQTPLEATGEEALEEENDTPGEPTDTDRHAVSTEELAL